MGGIGGIVILWVIFFQVLRLRLRVDKDETAFPALHHLEPAWNSVEPVPSLKKKAMLMRPTNFTGNRFHFLSHLFFYDNRGTPSSDDFTSCCFIRTDDDEQFFSDVPSSALIFLKSGHHFRQSSTEGVSPIPLGELSSERRPRFPSVFLDLLP